MERTARALQRLTRARFHVMENLTRETQFPADELILKVQQLFYRPFRHKTSATSLAVIEHFHSVEDIVQMSLDELLAFVDANGEESI